MKRGASSQRGERRRTNGAAIGKKSKGKRATQTDWKRLRLMSSAQIRKGIESDPEARATDENFWRTAKVVLPVSKGMVTMRLDSDLLNWFRRQPGYQTRINAILRAYMDAHASSRIG